MKAVTFKAFSPFEIGDTIKVNNLETEYTITDIACIHYVASNKVQFQYQLDGGKYVQLEDGRHVSR